MKIQIKLAEIEYQITVEPSCYNTVRLGTSEKGKPTESLIGYFTNMSQSIKKIVQFHMSELDEVLTLKEYADRIDEAHKSVIEQVDL